MGESYPKEKKPRIIKIGESSPETEDKKLIDVFLDKPAYRYGD